MTKINRISLAALALPLTLALAACGSETTAEGSPAGEPIAAIPAPEGQAWVDTLSVSPDDGYVMGNPDAPIKLIEYGSLTCGACAGFAGEATATLKEKYISSGVVSYELRNLVRGPDDLVLATLVRCGADEGYHPLSEQVWGNLNEILQPIYSNQEAAQQAMALPPEQRFAAFANTFGLTDFFAARGISRDQAQACLTNVEEVTAIAERSQKQAEELGVTATPTFFINGNNIGNQSWTTLEPMIQAAGAR